MTNYARIIDGVAVDVSTDPTNSFHPTIAAQFIKVPDKVSHGWRLVEGTWSAPLLQASLPVIPVQSGTLNPTPPEFLLLLTLQERVAIRAAGPTDLVIADVLRMLDDPRVTFIDLTNPSVVEAINYLTTTAPALLTAERAARVLSGLSIAA
ncbi:hypothetical protein [Pseudomonas syringae]|uniref:Uncharacterized protein n=1 Tax=Pseudomonas syringae TaxID=317 RepID=A0A085V491_PSESX|nr:hypothetical protein [Pseudomonas syringae]KFE50254.1 hypothetical protein IV02_17645 [Pseudomonas syringae]